MVPPDKIDPSVAGDTSMGESAEPTDKEKEKGEKFIRPKGGAFGGIGYSVALRDVKVVKKGKETINFNVRQHVERKTLAGGFIGIGRYPKELRKACHCCTAWPLERGLSGASPCRRLRGPGYSAG